MKKGTLVKMKSEKIQFAKSVAEWNKSHRGDSCEMDASKIAEVNREIAEIEKRRRKRLKPTSKTTMQTTLETKRSKLLEEAKAHEAKYTESEVAVKDMVII